MPEDDPADLERYWQRLRGPRPAPEPEPERAASSPMSAMKSVLQESLERVLWVAPFGPDGVFHGQRIRVIEQSPDPDGVDLHCVFPPATYDFEVIGVSVWDSAQAIQPLANARFDHTHQVLQGDSMDIHVRITL